MNKKILKIKFISFKWAKIRSFQELGKHQEIKY
jgi:hypothetical protein